MHPSCFYDISPEHFQLGCHYQLWIWIFRGERNAREAPVVIVFLKLLRCTCPGWGNLTSCHFHTGWRRQYRSSRMCWRRQSYTCGEALWAGKNKHMFYSRLHSITPTGNLTEQLTGSAVLVTTTGALTAGNVQQGAVDRWHPQVGWASVEHHRESLMGGAQANLAIILGLKRKEDVYGRYSNWTSVSSRF